MSLDFEHPQKVTHCVFAMSRAGVAEGLQAERGHHVRCAKLVCWSAPCDTMQALPLHCRSLSHTEAPYNISSGMVSYCSHVCKRLLHAMCRISQMLPLYSSFCRD